MDITQILALISVLVQVTFLEGVLSLDNAAVLGAVVISLPADQIVPWPHTLRRLGKVVNPLLGRQRTAALRVGLLGAYLGRGLMLLMASYVIRNPWLQLIGALYLLKISVAELGKPNSDEDEDGGKGSNLLNKAKGRSFWATVLMVELMDLAFSLDNVVVVISLSDKLWLVMLGVAIGILTMRFAAGLFTNLIVKIPALSVAAYVLVFNIGVEFVLERLFRVDIGDSTRLIINIGTLLLAVVYQKFKLLQKACRVPFKVCKAIFHGMDVAFNFILSPINWFFARLGGWIGQLFKARVSANR